jgi:hypothetical protein
MFGLLLPAELADQIDRDAEGQQNRYEQRDACDVLQ